MRMSEKALQSNKKTEKETKRIKPSETSRLALIRSYTIMMPTLHTNSDLICLNDTGEIQKYVRGRWRGRKREFLPGQT